MNRPPGMPFNFPIFLTWLRIAVIPLLVGIYYVPDTIFSLHEKNLIATLLFVAAAFTDWLDGYLARKWGQFSNFGAFLDPVADKLIVAAALLVLLNFDRVQVWVAIIIIGREITISALREWMALMGASASVAVHFLGKVKTTMQLIAVSFLLYDEPVLGVPCRQIGHVLIIIAALLTLWSMFYYLQKAKQVIIEKG
jgi:CDP-diacylglycerol--glycerol-3-phosphate 3-phosphatidyltransferase